MGRPAGALTGSLTEEGVHLVRQAWSDRSDRVRRFAEAIADLADTDVEDLISAAADDETRRVLLANAVTAATETSDDWKIRTLARACVRGADDGALVDEMGLLIETLRDIDVPELRMLAVLSHPSTEGVPALIYDWGPGDIAARDPGIGKVFQFLAKKLLSAELIYTRSKDPNQPLWRLTAVGRSLTNHLADLGSLTELEPDHP